MACKRSSVRLRYAPPNRDKLEKLSTVIEKLSDEDGPEILGVSEIENRRVIEDPIQMEKLKSRGYGIAHIESPVIKEV
jgi:hypothetical protein